MPALRAAALCTAILFAMPAVAGDKIAGPIAAQVQSVTDGDTIRAVATIWPGHVVYSAIRLAGIDTPEKAPRAACRREADLAAEATALVAGALRPGDAIQLWNVQPDKYFGRVVATVTTPAGRDLAAELIAAGLAVPYDGGRKSAPWCH